MKDKPKVLVGMSGGVDSAAAVKILLDAGYAPAGATFLLHDADAESGAQDAAEVCAALGVRHFVFDLRKEFSTRVIEPFLNSYVAGRTPNPCVECNRTVKFPELFRKADEYGFPFVATGHYARTAKRGGRILLLQGADKKKDQSYVLYNLKQEELARILFPLGGMTKAGVRAVAEKAGFTKAAAKPESQDICFIPDGDCAAFLRSRRPEEIRPGKFLTPDGTVAGEHKGMACYTIGQRRGLALAFGKPVYVTAKDPEANTVTVGGEEYLYADALTAESVNLISAEEIPDGMPAQVKIRYSQSAGPARLYPAGNGSVRVVFDEPRRAITTGQSAVFYDGETVIGGGVIASVSGFRSPH